jgi:AAA15 family ATPase/GTPase
MLDSLEIQNYRNFKHLRIEKLGRVNLIIGKNNTGKTSLLEAVSIWCFNDICKNDQTLIVHWLYYLASQRGENYTLRTPQAYISSDEMIDRNIKTIISLMYQRKVNYNLEYSAKIGNTDFENAIRFRIAKQYLQPTQFPQQQGNGIVASVQRHAENESEIPNGTAYSQVYESVVSWDKNRASMWALDLRTDNQSSAQKINNLIPNINMQIVWSKPPILVNENLYGTLADKVIFDSEIQESIIKSLKIIEPKADKLGFVVNDFNQRIAKVKLTDIENPVLATSMGDGINRILTIILAMVNCKDGYLLIDEFDNGLHVSVQKQLWEIVFDLANKLNIQVFATTHSHDCIDAFGYVLGSGKYAESDGIMVRLDNWEGNIDATIYEADDIFNTIRAEVDPR